MAILGDCGSLDLGSIPGPGLSFFIDEHVGKTIYHYYHINV